MLANVILVTYYSATKAQACIDAILETIPKSTSELHWTFVDNSEDSSDAKYIHSKLAEARNVTVIAMDHNPGFAAACNTAARGQNAEWTLLLNPDLILDDSVIESIAEVLREADESAMAIAFGMKTHGRMHQGVSFNSFGWFADRSYKSAQDCYGPSGGAGAYRTSKFLSLGGFQESLFAWGEDAEFALRLKEHGCECVQAPIVIDHLGGHSIEGSRRLAARKVELLLSNRFLIASQHYPFRLKLRFAVFATAVVLAKMPVYAKAGAAMVALKCYARGIVTLFRSDSFDDAYRRFGR